MVLINWHLFRQSLLWALYIKNWMKVSPCFVLSPQSVALGLMTFSLTFTIWNVHVLLGIWWPAEYTVILRHSHKQHALCLAMPALRDICHKRPLSSQPLLLELWWWFSGSVMSNSCDPMNCALPSSSVHGILQERILEWVAIYPNLVAPAWHHGLLGL